jgi:hypothetical protein
MTSKKRDGAALGPSKKGRRPVKNSHKTLTGSFFSDFERSWQEHGREMLCHLAVEQPLAYVRAMVKLALIEHGGSGDLSDFDRQRNRVGILQLLKDREAKYLRLVICLDSEAEPRMQAPEALFEHIRCRSIRCTPVSCATEMPR